MSGCPARSVLRAYEGGRLDEAEAEPVERHVATCQTCRADMDRIRATHPEARALRTAYLESQSGSTAFEPDVVAGRPTPGAAGQGGDTARRGGSTRGGPRTDGGVPRPVDDADWVVPDYERVLLCGEGSYGSVWAVRDRVGVYRALKIIDMARMSSAKVGCRESTALEAYCRKVSRHPALITVYHVGMIGNTLYYTMELADDESTRLPAHAEFPKYYRPLTLASVVTRRRVAPDVAVDIARRLLQGLARMHDLDLIHRDIKPGNIVWVNRRPKLADIGMVIPLSESGATIGTPRYMPPDKVMDRTADTYAMGKV
ncbi:MAG: protein kinase, partial [Phycisphaerae bacterium]